MEASIGQLENNMLVLLIPGLPILAAIIGYLFKRLGLKGTVLLGVGANLAVLATAAVLFVQERAYFVASWISLPDNQVLQSTGSYQSGIEIPLVFLVSPKSLLFIISTAAISLAVLAYAYQDRKSEKRGSVLVSTLNLFTGAMLLFLASDTLLLLYFAWELMGVCSYLLIAHSGTTEARRAARQAFWTTRVTDFALLFAIIIAMGRFGAVLLSQLSVSQIIMTLQQTAQDFGLSQGSPEFAVLRDTEFFWIGIILLLVIAAVVGKSALLPLSYWLPDAMVAPTPVSALLHAATMVAAGPYLLIQLGELFVFSEMAMIGAVLVGGVSLLLGGVMALCSTDPKRILAYSTISHMGLVVLGVGVLCAGPAYLHLLAHAWFKAALFIAVGMVITKQAANKPVTGSDQPIGTLKTLAGSAVGSWLLTAVLVLSGLSLLGLWGLGGFFGKENIFSGLKFLLGYEISGVTLADRYPLAAATMQFSWWVMLVSFAITAAYITRLVGVLCIKQAAPGKSTASALIDEDGLVSTPRSSSYSVAAIALLVVALVGSVGLGVAWQWLKGVITPADLQNPDANSLMWMGPDKFPYLWMIGLAFTLVGALVTYYLRIYRPALGDSVAKGGGALAWLKGFFGNGMYLGEFWTTLVGKTGEFLAILAAIADVGVLDSLAISSGKGGRAAANSSAWFDIHFIDGIRYRACEFWWVLKDHHSRYWQTGRIQRYMCIVVLWTAVLCLIIAKPLGESLLPLLQNLIDEGII